MAMDTISSLSSEDKQTWKDLFGPGSLREDIRQSTVNRIVERVLPLLTLERLRVGKLIPFLEKRNFIEPDSLANQKTDTEQVESICNIIIANPTSHTLFCLYASLNESGKEVPLHYQQTCEIKSIIHSECEADDPVGRPQDRGSVRSQPTAEATRSPNTTQEMTGQKSTSFCILPAEATLTPNSTGNKDASNSSGDKGSTNPSREISRHLTDIIATPPSSCQGSGPQQFVPGIIPSDGSPQGTSDPSPTSSLKNSLSSIMENNFGSTAPLSQANDFGSVTSSYQNELSAPSSSSSTGGPIELCDPNLLAVFNNPNESDFFTVLVQTGANVNLPTNHERSYLLHVAIDGMMLDKVQLLVQFGADTNVARADGRTPLHLACEKQLIELVKLLVEHGANVNAVDNNGMTCLHLMSTLEEPDIVDYLIQKGAIFDDPTKDGFKTPLTIATGLLKEKARQTVSLLLQAGASATGHPQSAVRPLVAAASSGHFDTVELLLSSAVDVNVRNKDGTTALMAAILGNHQDIVQLLLDKGANLSFIRSGPYTVSGNMVLMYSTALSDAAYLGNLPLVKLLKEKGANLTAGSQDENAPVVFAVMGGSVEVVDYIICKGELPENELFEAFVAAVKLRHDDCAVVVLNKSKGKEKMRDSVMRYCSGERMEKMIKSIGTVQVPSPTSRTSGRPDAHLPSLTEAPLRAILPGIVPSIVDDQDLFQPVQAFPPARQPPPSRSLSTHRSSSIGDSFNLMSQEGLGQEAHRHRLVEILHEFAQVCLKAALNNRTRDWLVDHAKKCHHPQLAEFFTSYYTYGGTSIDPSKSMDDFFHGEPSVLNFLIQRNIISKSRVQEVLKDMGRNSVEFFTELMEAFHHFPGTDHLPYDGDLLVTHLFEGMIVMGHRYRPSSEPFSSEPTERPPAMPTSGGHRLGGSTPPTSMRDLHSQHTSQQPVLQASQQPVLEASQQPLLQASQQTAHQASQQPLLQASQQINQLANPQRNQLAIQQTSNPTRQQGSQFSTQQPPPQALAQNQPLQSQSQSNLQPKLQHQLSNSLGEPPLGESGSRVPVGSDDASTPVRYGSEAIQAPAGRGQSTVFSGSSTNSFNEDPSINESSDKIDICNNFNTLGNEGSRNQMARSQLNITQSLESHHQSISKADTVASSLSSTAAMMGASVLHGSQPQVGNMSRKEELPVHVDILSPRIQQVYQKKSELKPQSGSLSQTHIQPQKNETLSQAPSNETVSQTNMQRLGNETLSQAQVPSNGTVLQTNMQRLGNETLSQAHVPSNGTVLQTHMQPQKSETLSQTLSSETVSQTQSPRNELLSRTPNEPLPLTPSLRNDPEGTVSAGEGTPEVIQSGTDSLEHLAGLPKPKPSSVTSTKDKTLTHAADGRQKQDRPRTTPHTISAKAKDETSRVSKASKPVTAPVPSSNKVQPISNAPIAAHRTLKPLKSTPAASETKSKGKNLHVKSAAKIAAVDTNDGGEEKVEEGERKGCEHNREKKMQDLTSGHRSSTDNAEENKKVGSGGATDFQLQNRVGLWAEPASFPGGVNKEESRSFVVHIDIPNGTSGSTQLDELSARFEAARTKCMCTHAHVTLKYGSTKDGPSQVSDSTFMAPLSQCHTVICALCSYMKCSSVLVSANLLVF